MIIDRLHPILRRFRGPENNDAPGADGSTPSVQQEPPTFENNPRLQAMKAIANKNIAYMADEHKAQGMDAPLDAPPPVPSPDDDTASAPAPAPASTPAPAPAPADSPAPSPAPAAPAPAPASDPAADQITLQLGQTIDAEALDKVMVRMKVDGVVQVKPWGEWRRDVQLDGAAQARLAQATKLLQQVKDAAQSPAAPAPSAAAPAAVPPVGNDGKLAKKDIPDVATTAQRLTQALLDGDEKAATEAMQETLATLFAQKPGDAAAAVDLQTLTAQLVPVVKQQLSNEEVEAQFTAANQDIVADPYLAGIADDHLAQVQKELPNSSYQDQLAEAVTRTRDWMKAKGMAVQPATEQPVPNRSGKLTERKQLIDNVSGLSSKATPPVQETKTTSQVIDAMRRTRVSGAVA
jgi:hypothetical protein